MTSRQETFMQQALALAARGLGYTAPNPPVGALLVRGGQVVGSGFHPQAGQPHAEIFALREAGALARGAELYVTLEPCCHQGRTGPCTEALIAAGVARVFIGTGDPNPQVAGRGIARLREAGIEVVSGPCEEACRRLIAPFAKHLGSGLPYVLYKAAMTLDGRIATASGDSRWISGIESRTLVHRLRSQVDAVMVGAQTVLADDPQLTVRLVESERQPLRVVLDGSLRTQPQARVYSQESSARTLLLTADDHADASLRPYRDAGVEVLQIARADGHLDLPQALRRLGERNVQHLLLEGGAGLGGAMLRGGLIDRLMLFVAPKLLGGDNGRGLFAGPGAMTIDAAWRLSEPQLTQVGEDFLIEGEVVACSPD